MRAKRDIYTVSLPQSPGTWSRESIRRMVRDSIKIGGIVPHRIAEGAKVFSERREDWRFKVMGLRPGAHFASTLRVTDARRGEIVRAFLANGHHSGSPLGGTLYCVLEHCWDEGVSFVLRYVSRMGYSVAKGEELPSKFTVVWIEEGGAKDVDCRTPQAVFDELTNAGSASQSMEVATKAIKWCAVARPGMKHDFPCGWVFARQP